MSLCPICNDYGEPFCICPDVLVFTDEEINDMMLGRCYYCGSWVCEECPN